jgi:Flp pilus assembly pilin Flp
VILVLGTWLHARSQRDEAGASLVEYLLLVSLIAMAVMAAVIFLGDDVNSKYDSVGSELNNR